MRFAVPYDSHFLQSGVSFFVSSGDAGLPAEYPSASPNVISVGGTTLTFNAGHVRGGWWPRRMFKAAALESRSRMSCADEMLAVAAARQDELKVSELGPRPRRKVAVLACMDARMDLFAMLGLARGDAHIIRNAGGLVTDDALRSLSVSQRLLGTEEIVVVMHDGCGLHGASEDHFAAQLALDGAAPTWRLGAFEDLEATLRDGLARLRSSPELPARDQIRGFIYNPENGALREIAEAAESTSRGRALTD